MDHKQAFGLALRKHRNHSGLSQEAFSNISSRTYLSTLERGLKSPTLEKIEQLSQTMGIHPVTLVVDTYLMNSEGTTLNELLESISKESLFAGIDD